MSEYELMKFVRETIRREIAHVMMGSLVSNDGLGRVSVSRGGVDSETPNLRSIQPYGVSSRGPSGMDIFMAHVNGDITHPVMAGHFDKNRPDGEDGETIIYNQFGQLVYLKSGKILLGSKTATENLVLGQVFKTMMSTLLDAIANHTHPGLGYQPSNFADFEALKYSPIEDEAILSDEVFTEKG